MRRIIVAALSAALVACTGQQKPPSRVAVAGGARSESATQAGRIDYWVVGKDLAVHIPYGDSAAQGASFKVAWDPGRAVLYAPTPAGSTYVVDPVAGNATGAFPTIAGGRVAAFDLDNDLILVLSSDSLAAYRAANHERLFADAVGGNALALDHGHDRVFVGGNADSVITQVDLSAGEVARTFPVAHSGDLVLASGRVFSADMKTGVVSSFNPDSGQITRTATDEVDPDFSYDAIAKAKAGFMQMAAGPAGDTVYAAGFSGRIMAFDAATGARTRTIKVTGADQGTGPFKLSGLVILPGGQALTTAENRQTTFVVNLASGDIVRSLDSTHSNRWVLINPAP
ncbi:MAG: hypothetical protein P8174_00860 [Gemmatimonadota bacterium]